MIKHHPTHWVAVAIALGFALLTLHEAHGQSAATVFQGRPALAGAQGGLGAQSGLPQGGIGVQGSVAAELALRPPRIVREERQARETAAGPTRRNEVAPGDVVATLGERAVEPARIDPDITPQQARSAVRQGLL